MSISMMSPSLTKADGAADGGFGADVADACAACSAAESAVSYEGDGFAEACAHDVACGARAFPACRGRLWGLRCG